MVKEYKFLEKSYISILKVVYFFFFEKIIILWSGKSSIFLTIGLSRVHKKKVYGLDIHMYVYIYICIYMRISALSTCACHVPIPTYIHTYMHTPTRTFYVHTSACICIQVTNYPLVVAILVDERCIWDSTEATRFTTLDHTLQCLLNAKQSNYTHRSYRYHIWPCRSTDSFSLSRMAGSITHR